LAEITDELSTYAAPANIPGTPILWDGNIQGGECNSAPTEPPGVSTLGYGLHLAFPVEDVEASPSSLGGWLMEFGFEGGLVLDAMFDREFIKPVSGYPSEGSETERPYDPRAVNSLSLNCQVATDGDPDETKDAPDDFLTPGELSRPATLAQQVLVEMSRGRKSVWDLTAGPGAVDETVALATRFNNEDLFAIDGDSWDEDEECTWRDMGNNMHGTTVRSGEGALVIAAADLDRPAIGSELLPHIRFNENRSNLVNLNAAGEPVGQSVYRFTDPGSDILGNSLGTVIRLQSGTSYTLIVGGVDETRGNYEIRIRKANPDRISPDLFWDRDASTVCNLVGIVDDSGS